MHLTVKEFKQQKELTRKIIRIDPNIRFVGIINSQGKISTGSLRKNIQLKVPQDQCEMLYMEATLRMRMRQEFDQCLGPVNFCMSHRGNFIITKYPYQKGIVYVSSDKNFDFAKTPFKIIKTIRKFNPA